MPAFRYEAATAAGAIDKGVLDAESARHARSLLREGLASQIDTTLGDAFAFDGARCDRIVAGVLRRAAAEGLSRGG